MGTHRRHAARAGVGTPAAWRFSAPCEHIRARSPQRRRRGRPVGPTERPPARAHRFSVMLFADAGAHARQPHHRPRSPRPPRHQQQHPRPDQQHAAGDLQREPRPRVRLRVLVRQGLGELPRGAGVGQVDRQRDDERRRSEDHERPRGRRPAAQCRQRHRRREHGDDQQRVAVVGAAGRTALDDLQRADGHVEHRGEFGGDEQRDGGQRERPGQPPCVHEIHLNAKGPLL